MPTLPGIPRQEVNYLALAGARAAQQPPAGGHGASHPHTHASSFAPPVKPENGEVSTRHCLPKSTATVRDYEAHRPLPISTRVLRTTLCACDKPQHHLQQVRDSTM